MSMIKVFLKHKITSLIILVFFTLFIFLGSWQIYRYQEKREYLDSIYSSLQKEPLQIKENSQLAPFSKIFISGEMLTDSYFWLYRRHPLAKQKDGAYLVVPFRTSFNEIFLVILGWVEKSYQQNIINEIKLKKENLQVTGLLLNSERNSIFLPGNDYKNRIYFTMSIPEIAKMLDMKLPDYFIASLDGNSKFETQLLPITAEMMIKVKNDHIEYATTWYSIALSLVLIYYLILKRKTRDG